MIEFQKYCTNQIYTQHSYIQIRLKEGLFYIVSFICIILEKTFR